MLNRQKSKDACVVGENPRTWDIYIYIYIYARQWWRLIDNCLRQRGQLIFP